MITCSECDGEMLVAEEERPMMLVTGDIDTGTHKLGTCKICGNIESLD